MAERADDAGELLDPSRVDALVEALEDSSEEVRLAAFEALVRLPLGPSTQDRVARYVDRVMGSSPSVHEGLVVRQRASALGAHPAEDNPLRPRWAEREPPGFTSSDETDLARARRTLDLGDSLEPDLATAIVTVVFEGEPSAVDDVLQLVRRLQGRFRPDLDRLFRVYRALLVTSPSDVRRIPAMVERDDDERRLSRRVAWTISRGGLTALLEGLAARLRSRDPEERLAAACLIADAAAYVIEADPPRADVPRPPAPPRRSSVVERARTESGREAAVQMLDEDVQFSVYRPRQIQPARWYPLLAFAHRTSVIEDPESGPVDPVEIVEQQAQALLQGQPVPFGVVRSDSQFPLPRGTDLLFEPWLEGGELNPTLASLRWEEPVHRVEFRIRAPASSEGRRLPGGMRVFMGALLVGEVTFQVSVSASLSAGETPTVERLPVKRFRKIFASYSHADAQVVAAVAHYVSSVGDRYLIDAQTLRSGERWEPRLAQLIEEADVFQLFWSRNAMASTFVRAEWEHALRLGREGFIRPVYWEEPLPRDNTLGLPPDALLRLHFSRLGVAAAPCLNCGFVNVGEASFCSRCGTFLRWSEVRDAPPRPVPVPPASADVPLPGASVPPPAPPATGAPQQPAPVPESVPPVGAPAGGDERVELYYAGAAAVVVLVVLLVVLIVVLA